MIIAVTGGRDYNDMRTVYAVLDEEHKAHHIRILVHGCARGADTLCAAWAMNRGVHPAGIPALWDFYQGGGEESAGPIRNRAMLWLPIERLIAFPGGAGTANMVGQVRQAGIPVRYAVNQDLVGG